MSGFILPDICFENSKYFIFERKTIKKTLKSVLKSNDFLKYFLYTF